MVTNAASVGASGRNDTRWRLVTARIRQATGEQLARGEVAEVDHPVGTEAAVGGPAGDGALVRFKEWLRSFFPE